MSTNGSHGGWVAMCLLFALTIFMPQVRGQQDEFLPAWVKTDWDYWAQGSGRWIAENKYKSENEPFDAYGMEWKLGLGRKSLRGRLFAIRDGKEVGTIWEFHSFWHPTEKKVILSQFGSDGTYATGEMKNTGETTTESLERFFGAKGTTFQVGHRAERRPGEVPMQSFDVSDSGEWKPRRSYVWKLQAKTQ